MNEPKDKAPWDWIEQAARLARVIGLNPVQVRWKLMAWRESWRNAQRQTQASVQHINYQHKICPTCNNVQDRGNKVCSNCGNSLSPRIWEILKRIGIVSPQFGSVSSLLTALLILAYVRMVLYQGGDGFFSFRFDTLVHFGGNLPPTIQEWRWWRLSTYIFLHAGLWHIAFNLIALQQIGPQIEEVFGKGRMLFFFMVTGIAAGLGSELLGLHSVGIGASGSLMGLIGLAAGWGHKDGTRTGIAIRNFMAQWGLYTIVFGFLVRADNAAHASGFACGFLLGLLARPQWDQRRSRALDGVMTFIGVVLAAGTAFLVFFPPG